MPNFVVVSFGAHTKQMCQSLSTTNVKTIINDPYLKNGARHDVSLYDSLTGSCIQATPQLVPKSVTSNDPERHHGCSVAFFAKRWALEPTTSN